MQQRKTNIINGTKIWAEIKTTQPTRVLKSLLIENIAINQGAQELNDVVI